MPSSGTIAVGTILKIFARFLIVICSGVVEQITTVRSFPPGYATAFYRALVPFREATPAELTSEFCVCHFTVAQSLVKW